MKPWLKRRKNLKFYETLIADLRLEEEYNYNILLRLTSENSEEIFQLIKDVIPKENTKLRELIPPRLKSCNRNWLFINRGVIQEFYGYEYYSS